MLCTNKCTAASYCRSRNNCRSIDIIIIIVVIIILVIIVIVIMKLAISFSKLRLETDEIKLTLRNRFWQLCLLTNNYSSILYFFGNMIPKHFPSNNYITQICCLTGLYKLLHPACLLSPALANFPPNVDPSPASVKRSSTRSR